ncbi:MAG: hypothetical protein OXD31_05230 [Chloroflexi bacterium]|nr:hypothetical protein [Chloroflexota bacterium]
MPTRSLVGYQDKDGYGAAVYVQLDGYPAGVGRTLLEHWDDPDKVKSLVDGGSIHRLSARTTLDDVEYGPQVEGYPAFLTPDDTPFFDRNWDAYPEYIYLHTPDGWFGKSLQGDTAVKPIAALIKAYDGS